MSEYRKCDRAGGYVCRRLAERTELYNGPRGKGIKCWVLTDLNTMKQTQTIVGYKMSAKDKGLVFVFCPFCGVQINERVDGHDVGFLPPVKWGDSAHPEE